MTAAPRRGFALVAALALLVTISVVALELSVTARPRRLAIANAATHVAAVQAATAGVEHARAVLLRMERAPASGVLANPSQALDPWSAADGTIIGPLAVGPYLYRVELHDAYRQLNLNSATEDQLRRLLLSLRVDARRADRLAQAIADWRDPDQFPRMNGAERNDYIRAGRPLLPDDGPFADVSSLRFVMGMSDSLFLVLRQYLTTMGDGGVNLNVAPRPVLLALPGMSEEAADVLLRDRAAGRRVLDLVHFVQEIPAASRPALVAALPQLRVTTVVDTHEVRVVSEAWQPGESARTRIDAIISRDAQGRVIWRRVSP